MIGAMYAGITGMNLNLSALNVESNNIANVNTVGFKSNNISFSDMIKGQSANVDKNFSIGNFVSTTNPLDMAIEGSGFFVVADVGQDYYTRAGNFKMGATGNLVNSEGFNVMGLTANIDVASSSEADTIFDYTYTQFIATQYIENGDNLTTINTKASNYSQSVEDDVPEMSGLGFKTAAAKIRDIEALIANYQKKLSSYGLNQTDGSVSVSEVHSVAFDPNIDLVAGDSMGITINGNLYTQEFDVDFETTIKKLSDQISNITGVSSSVDSATGEMMIKSLIPGSKTDFANAYAGSEFYNINLNTSAVAGSGLLDVQLSYNTLADAITNVGGKVLSLTNNVSLEAEKVVLEEGQAFEFKPIQLRLDTLGNSNVSFGEISVSNGAIFVTQGLNKYIVGKVPTVDFADKTGLVAIGGTKFKALTAKSGMPMISSVNDKVVGNYLEMSNADLSSSLTKLMVYQRAFEANSRTVTTSDEFLNIAIQLKK